MLVFVEMLSMDSGWVKVIAQIIVIVSNYIASKLIVFKYKKE